MYLLFIWLFCNIKLGRVSSHQTEYNNMEINLDCPGLPWSSLALHQVLVCIMSSASPPLPSCPQRIVTSIIRGLFVKRPSKNVGGNSKTDRDPEALLHQCIIVHLHAVFHILPPSPSFKLFFLKRNFNWRAIFVLRLKVLSHKSDSSVSIISAKFLITSSAQHSTISAGKHQANFRVKLMAN